VKAKGLGKAVYWQNVDVFSYAFRAIEKQQGIISQEG